MKARVAAPLTMSAFRAMLPPDSELRVMWVVPHNKRLTYLLPDVLPRRAVLNLWRSPGVQMASPCAQKSKYALASYDETRGWLLIATV